MPPIDKVPERQKSRRGFLEAEKRWSAGEKSPRRAAGSGWTAERDSQDMMLTPV